MKTRKKQSRNTRARLDRLITAVGFLWLVTTFLVLLVHRPASPQAEHPQASNHDVVMLHVPQAARAS
jgi:hypothetical protein